MAGVPTSLSASLASSIMASSICRRIVLSCESSASRGTTIGVPHKITPLVKSLGTKNRSQLFNSQRRRADHVAGMMGTPDRRAIVTIPAEARIRGPLGPSGVMPMHSPFFKVRKISRRAANPPFSFASPGWEVLPLMVLIPSGFTMRVISSPSRFCDISI